MPQSRGANGDIVVNVHQPRIVSLTIWHPIHPCMLPPELGAAGPKPPRWHAFYIIIFFNYNFNYAENDGAVGPFISVVRCHAFMLEGEKSIAVTARKPKLEQHWVSYEGRKLDDAALVEARRRKRRGWLEQWCMRTHR